MMLKVFIRLAGREDPEQPAPFFIDNNAKWTAVKLLLASYYGDVCPDDLDVRYWDEEDYVIISSQEELEEAFRLAEDKSYLQLYVRLMDPDDSSSSHQLLAASTSVSAASAGPSEGDAAEQAKSKRGNRENSDHSMLENPQSSELPKTGKLQTISEREITQRKTLDDLRKTAVDTGEEQPVDLTKKTLAKAFVKPVEDRDTSSAENVQLMDYLLNHSARSASISGAAAIEPTAQKNREKAKMHRRSLDAADVANLQKMMAKAGDISYEDGHMEQGEEEEAADQGRFMLPGALSGANVIAIEMPEMEQHQGTEIAEPAEIAETGEVSSKSSRDAETGFWMQPQLEAGVKEELRRKLSSLVMQRERARYDHQQKKLERRSSRADGGHKKKKHHAGSTLTEDTVSDILLKGEAAKSSTSLNSSSPLDVVSEEVSSDTPPPLPKKHERKASKSEGKKKKHHSDVLTEDAFVRYMTKFESQLKKDLGKEVARKTVRSVIKNLPKHDQGSEVSSNPLSVTSKRAGFVHEDIICDCCDREIVGTRYICGNCPNYDLCEECEDIQPSFHDRTHVFIKLRRPCLKAGTHHGVRVPLLKRIIYESKDEERKVDPGRIQVIMERTKAQEGQLERRMSRNNNNNEDGEEGELSDEQMQLEQGRHDQLPEKPATLSADEMMEKAWLLENTRPTSMTEDRKSEAEMVTEFCQLQPFSSSELISQIIADYILSPSVDSELPDQCGQRKCDMQEESAPEVLEAFKLEEDWGRDGKDFLDNDVDAEVSTGESLLKVKSDDDQKDDETVPELVEDGFVICSATQTGTGEQVTNHRGMSPASSIEVVDTDNHDISEAEVLNTSQQPPVVNWSSDDKADFQQQEEDNASIHSSLTDESSSDEDFVVIVPDCFDISIPLDPNSLAQLACDKAEKLKDRKNTSEDDPHLAIPPCEMLPLIPLTEARIRTPEEKKEVHLLSHTEGSHSTSSNQLGNVEYNAGRAENDTADDLMYTPLVDLACFKTPFITGETGENEPADEEADVEEEEHASHTDVLPEEKADTSQCEASATVGHPSERREPSNNDEVSGGQSHSHKSTTEDAEDSDIEETDLKHLPESDEEGAAAAADSILDPDQQLNQMMTNTIKKASSGLQQLFQTGKDIFRNLQRGDSFEYKESDYVFKPTDYKLPESTWQPSNKEYVPPKSNFKVVKSEYQMPMSTYTEPQSQVSSGAGTGGEFAGPLQRIREMGYFNNERTLCLLKKYEGDVQKAVNELIEETDNDWADRRHGDCS